ERRSRRMRSSGGHGLMPEGTGPLRDLHRKSSDERLEQGSSIRCRRSAGPASQATPDSPLEEKVSRGNRGGRRRYDAHPKPNAPARLNLGISLEIPPAAGFRMAKLNCTQMPKLPRVDSIRSPQG